MTNSTLRLNERADRLHVVLHRPEARNAINQQMVDELHLVCDQLEADPKILVLSGEGRTFAAGADIGELRGRRRDDALRGINSALFYRIRELPMPVIAAIDGHALGGGAELAYAADFRIGTPRLRLGNPETGLGIMAAAGATWRLKELVGEQSAKRMLLAGHTLDGEESLRAGLVSELHDPEELLAGAHALADRIAEQDPLAVRITKAVFHAPASAHPVIDNLAQGILFESTEKFDRMQRFLDRNKTRRDAQGTKDN